MSIVSDERVGELLLIEELYEALKKSFDTIADQLCDRETRIRKLEELILSVRKQGPLADVINNMIREADKIERARLMNVDPADTRV
jgi:hypothetical protein